MDPVENQQVFMTLSCCVVLKVGGAGHLCFPSSLIYILRVHVALFSALSCSKSRFGMRDVIGNNCWVVLSQLRLEELDLFLCSFILALGRQPLNLVLLRLTRALSDNLIYGCIFPAEHFFFSFSGCNKVFFLVSILLLLPSLSIFS